MSDKTGKTNPEKTSNGRPRVLVCDSIAEEGLTLLAQVAQVEVHLKLPQAKLVEMAPEYDGILVRSQTQITAEVIEAASRLKVIGRAGIGVDNIDVEAATRKGVVVVNSPTAVNVAAAEHAIALMLSLSRNIPQADSSLRSGKWERSKFLGIEVRGKTLGLVGLGNIGSEVAKRAIGLEMQVLGLDPFVSEEYAQRLGIRLATLDEILEQADFISVHVPLTASTKGLIGKDELARAKAGVRLINCARGGIIDEEALYEALESGKVAGAALDVFTHEPPTASPLITHPKVVVTPHLGASTEEAQVTASIEVAEQVIAVLSDRPARYAVNTPRLRPEILAKLGPYIALCEKLGSLLAQLGTPGATKIEIAISGEIAEYDTTLLRAATVNGFLSEASPEHVNLVNALLIARNRGIHITERKSTEPEESYSDLITIRLDGGPSAFISEISGTAINGDSHIVRINDYRVDVATTSGGYLLFCHHNDRPGVIGRIGTLLGDRDINISFMQVGRRQARGEAMMVLGLDETISEDSDLFKLIVAAGDIQTARLARL